MIITSLSAVRIPFISCCFKEISHLQPKTPLMLCQVPILLNQIGTFSVKKITVLKFDKNKKNCPK